MKFEFFPEECCEDCGEIVHNHFKCPACGDDYAGTNVYGYFDEYIDEDFILECSECGSKFKITSIDESSSDPIEERCNWEAV